MDILVVQEKIAAVAVLFLNEAGGLVRALILCIVQFLFSASVWKDAIWSESIKAAWHASQEHTCSMKNPISRFYTGQKTLSAAWAGFDKTLHGIEQV